MSFKTTTKVFKFLDPNDKIANLVRGGMTVEDAVKKFSEKFIGKEEHTGNLALNAGITLLLQLLGATASPTAFSSAASSMGIGDSATAAVATQTNLLAASNKQYNVMDSTYPTVVNQTITWQATFASADANFAWQEYVINNATNGAGTSLNRIVTSKGTKAVGETWILQIQITPA